MALETSLNVSMKWDGANKLSNTSCHQFHKVCWLFHQDLSKFRDEMSNFRGKNQEFFRFFNIFWHFSYWKSIYCVDLCAYTLKLCWWIVKMEELANNHKIFHQIDQFQEYFHQNMREAGTKNFFWENHTIPHGNCFYD